MNDLRRRQRPTPRQRPIQSPRETARPRTAGQPPPPDALHRLPQAYQGAVVPGNPVVRVVPTQLLAQCLVLLGYRSVTVTPAPLGDRPDRSAEPVRGRPTLHHRVPLPRLPPPMSEAQEVE